MMLKQRKKEPQECKIIIRNFNKANTIKIMCANCMELSKNIFRLTVLYA